MIIKTIIVLLFIGVLMSLFGGLNFLVKDLGNSRKRLLNLLWLRVVLATLLLMTILIGSYTGQLKSNAPWDKKLHPENTVSPVN
tara:strand:- start:2260 stop:2511 length:252 start_codon:yes stop_codon:yes gene_type:complete